jgi:hypothetical protein
MDKIFSKIMTILFAITLGLFLTLGIVVIILGPERTDKAIKSLFNLENYKDKYKEINPFLSEDSSDENFVYNHSEVMGQFESRRDIIDKTSIPPLTVPSSGIAPRAAFLYTGRLDEGLHEGIDIWTNTEGKGMDGKAYKKGNPVYVSCDGYVHNVWEENGDVAVICDPIDELYQDTVPSLNIKTLYGHMADQFSDEVYIYVKKGQKVKQGDLIGHQGNRCYWSPQNIIVHLHFGVYDINQVPQVPLDPTPYIGVSCTTLNQVFKTDQQ